MTQRRNDPDRISNYFDRVLNGIGHRGSSFSDIDAVTHDEATNRFLFQEFKRPGELIPIGQRRLLQGLARRDYLTVWCIRRRRDGRLDFRDFGADMLKMGIEVEEYQARFRAWWDGVECERKVFAA